MTITCPTDRELLIHILMWEYVAETGATWEPPCPTVRWGKRDHCDPSTDPGVFEPGRKSCLACIAKHFGLIEITKAVARNKKQGSRGI